MTSNFLPNMLISGTLNFIYLHRHFCINQIMFFTLYIKHKIQHTVYFTGHLLFTVIHYSLCNETLTLCSSRALRIDTLCSRSLTSLSCCESVWILILLWYAFSSSSSCCSCIFSAWYSASWVSSNLSWRKRIHKANEIWLYE